MGLINYAALEHVEVGENVRLNKTDLPSLQALYMASYPKNWFDPRMLETGHYFGIKEGDAIVCVAGVHVYSPRYRVAALGNISTHPECSGAGPRHPRDRGPMPGAGEEPRPHRVER
jgi:hypothetical protein